jgi:serine/threonine protein kinase
VIGQRFGNYRAVSLLGEGGMGAVYLAEHPEIGRRVAVKILRPELIRDRSLLVRFLNEARAANAIRHPNIIEVLDSGTTPEGVPYLVMELLEGEVLAGRIRRVGHLPLREALEFSYQAASALAAAHSKGIIHRDLKPDNLFLVPDPSDPEREMVKVLDFGIAKLQTLPTGGGMQTRTGTVMGTPVYMSPEQCLGTKTVDHRSDIYALGIIMFEMLAGRPPFVSEGFGALVNMHLNVRPPSLHELNPAVTPAVQALIEKALEKLPEGRHRTASELQADIRAAAGRSIMLRGSSSPDLMAETLPGATAGSTRLMPPGSTSSRLGSVSASSTTLSSGTGERAVPTDRPKSKRGVALAVGGALVAAVGGAGGWFAYTHGGKAGWQGGGGGVANDRGGGPSGRRDGGNQDEPAGGPKTKDLGGTTSSGLATTIRLTIDSDPSGATVTDAVSGADLGTTPLVLERRPSPVPLKVRVSRAGWKTSSRELDVAHDGHEVVALAESAPAGGNTTDAVRPTVKHVKAGAKDRPPHHVRPPPAEEEPAKL